ncbi:hypothetical protein HMPREF0322_01084 [Desulfitobacterium hafniense DP7]|uniref:Uncharacterized protein n=1 Tax=Desulfitobacterium hafniense DP7 TaxID=537010 RepID=G9XJF3_DESHA|nr:hypothetical protein HMPREF0322_01084 [Desulfitobacterium hafniense DP7]
MSQEICQYTCRVKFFGAKSSSELHNEDYVQQGQWYNREKLVNGGIVWIRKKYQT